LCRLPWAHQPLRMSLKTSMHSNPQKTALSRFMSSQWRGNCCIVGTDQLEGAILLTSVCDYKQNLAWLMDMSVAKEESWPIQRRLGRCVPRLSKVQMQKKSSTYHWPSMGLFKVRMLNVRMLTSRSNACLQSLCLKLLKLKLRWKSARRQETWFLP